MHRNPYWLCFLGLLGACIFGYSGFAGIKLYRYAAYSVEVTPQNLQWKAVLREGEFYVEASYSYPYQGEWVQSRSELPERHLNRWAAEKKVEDFQKRVWKAWVDPRRPADSTLQKNFPFKECISTALLWGILGYFMWLGFYVGRYGRNHT